MASTSTSMAPSKNSSINTGATSPDDIFQVALSSLSFSYNLDSISSDHVRGAENHREIQFSLPSAKPLAKMRKISFWGCLIPIFSANNRNFFLSSARSIEAKGSSQVEQSLPYVNALPMFKGVCPPNWMIVPSGFSISDHFTNMLKS